jgi:hypothetical protein
MRTRLSGLYVSATTLFVLALPTAVAIADVHPRARLAR